MLFQDKTSRLSHPCPYLPDQESCLEYFLASGLTFDELDKLLSSGWRKFGVYYFRPDCPNCLECVPLRIQAKSFTPTKSQRRIIKRGEKITLVSGPLDFKKEIFDIYSIHSKNRFNKESNLNEFYYSFYEPSCPAMQSEYYLDGKLIAAGFLDWSSNSLSSVYFMYDTDYKNYNLGTLSIIRETKLAAAMGLDYYYLGYTVSENRSMAYKDKFHPHEIYDWNSKVWLTKEY
ncbi:MAG: arginyltransferase [Leptospirales bacterium]|nr:arginyltransferase [Leptospirales bacterium]